MIRRWSILFFVVVIGAAADQTTKYLAHIHLRNREIVTVIDGFFDLRYSLNPGVFFGIGSDISDGIRNVVLVTLNFFAIGLILHLYRKTRPEQKSLSWALVLLLSGAVGNLIDRLVRGEVVDFLHLHFRELFHWATFNLADVLLAVGLVLLIFDLIQKRSASRPEPTSTEMG